MSPICSRSHLVIGRDDDKLSDGAEGEEDGNGDSADDGDKDGEERVVVDLWRKGMSRLFLRIVENHLF